MDNKTKLSVFILTSLSVYIVLTLPMFIAFFTMDIETGDYSGIIYPQWLCIILGVMSAILGSPIAKYIIKEIAKYIIKKSENNNENK